MFLHPFDVGFDKSQYPNLRAYCYLLSAYLVSSFIDIAGHFNLTIPRQTAFIAGSIITEHSERRSVLGYCVEPFFTEFSSVGLVGFSDFVL